MGIADDVPEPETEEDLPPGIESMVPHSSMTVVRTELEQIQSQIDQMRPQQRNTNRSYTLQERTAQVTEVEHVIRVRHHGYLAFLFLCSLANHI
jgi:hypothetical protein